MKARLLLREKRTDRQGDLLEVVVWSVLASTSYPDGIRYRLAFIPLDKKTPAVLYDNHHPKGHHKHLEDSEQSYIFFNMAQLFSDFRKDVRSWKKTRRLLK